MNKLSSIYEDLVILREYLDLDDTIIGYDVELLSNKNELIEMLTNDLCDLEEIITGERK